MSDAISLNLAADLTDSSISEIVALNPALLRLATPRDLAYDLHLPPGTKDTFLTRLKDIPAEDRSSWRFHVVKPGETLEGIATSFHITAENLSSYNEVTPAQPIAPGDELVVPIATASSVLPGQQRYSVHRGDTLVSVADRFGVTVEQLRTWNASTRLTPGRSLYVAEPIRLAPGGRGRRAGARGSSSAHGARHASSHQAVARGGSSSRKRHR